MQRLLVQRLLVQRLMMQRLMMQRLVMLRLNRVMLVRLQGHVGGHWVQDVALTGVPHFERRAGRERVGVGLGNFRLGDLGCVDSDGQRCVDVWRWEERLVLRMEVDWMERGRGLAVCVIHQWVAFAEVPCGSVCMGKETGQLRQTLEF